MTEPLADTWHTRDLPVLRFLVKHFDQAPGQPIRIGDVALGMTPNVGDIFWDNTSVRSAVANLDRDNLVEIVWQRRHAGKVIDAVAEVRGQALREVGVWPNPSAAADRLLAALEELVEHGDEPTQSKARKALDGLGSLTRDTLVSVAGAAAGVAMQ